MRESTSHEADDAARGEPPFHAGVVPGGKDAPPSSRRFRLIFAALGVVSVGLAVLGAILPIMPTTIFLIFAAYCFARSSPALGRKLLGARIFRPYMRYVDGEKRMPPRARVLVVVWVWASLALSLGLLSRRGPLHPWMAIAAIALGILSMLGIWLTGRRAPTR